MEAYRDQYATLFNNGKNVAVIAISTDDDTVQANWAKEKNFPVFFASDPDKSAGNAYDVAYPIGNLERRVLFVIGADGRVAHIMRPFKELVADSYTELGEAVRKSVEAGAAKP